MSDRRSLGHRGSDHGGGGSRVGKRLDIERQNDRCRPLFGRKRKDRRVGEGVDRKRTIDGAEGGIIGWRDKPLPDIAEYARLKQSNHTACHQHNDSAYN